MAAEKSACWKKFLVNEYELDLKVVPGDGNCLLCAPCASSYFQNTCEHHHKLKNHAAIDAFLLREYISDTYQKAPEDSFYRTLINVYINWVAGDESNDSTEEIIMRIIIEGS